MAKKAKVVELKKGMKIRTERLGTVQIAKVWPLGTYDVITLTGETYRLTGLYGAVKAAA